MPGTAKFCPRCGRDMAGGQPGGLIGGAVPSTSRMPVAGMVFVACAILGPTLIAVGIYAGAPALLYGGIVVAIGLIVLLLLGMFF